MTLPLIITTLTVVAMVVTVLVKPYVNIGKFRLGLYWVVCLVGAIAMLCCGCISFESAFSGIIRDTSVNPIKILVLFLSMTILSIYLGDAGFFDYVAGNIFAKTKSGQFKLFIILYTVISVLTVFTSNDVIILTFTPPICLFCKKAGISPIPFLIGEFVAANTWSMTLIVGNPTNVYLAQSAGITFAEYFSVMALPAIAGGITGLLVILLFFRKQLMRPIEKKVSDSSPTRILVLKTPMIIAIVHLIACIILLAISDFIGFEMWLVCLALALSLTIFNLVYYLARFRSVSPVWRSIKKEPFELIPFVLSMFIIVLALKECGATRLLNQLLVSGNKVDGLTMGVLSSLSANLLNNIPMSVLFEGIIANSSTPAIYGAVIGSNVGAFITPVGALAGIMWNKILGEYHVKLHFAKFIAYGCAVAIPTLLASSGVLFLVI